MTAENVKEKDAIGERNNKMRIGIPVDNNNINTSISVSFGRAPWFAILDTSFEEYTFIKNVGSESSGGAGIKAAQMLIDSKVEVLLTPRCGENAAEVLKKDNIKIYKVENLLIKESIEAYKRGDLPELSLAHKGFHSNGEAK